MLLLLIVIAEKKNVLTRPKDLPRITRWNRPIWFLNHPSKLYGQQKRSRHLRIHWSGRIWISSAVTAASFFPLCQKPCWTMTNEDWSIIILASQLPGVNKSWQGCCAEKQRQGKKETDNKRQEKRGWSKMETCIDLLWIPLSDGGPLWCSHAWCKILIVVTGQRFHVWKEMLTWWSDVTHVDGELVVCPLFSNWQQKLFVRTWYR